MATIGRVVGFCNTIHNEKARFNVIAVVAGVASVDRSAAAFMTKYICMYRNYMVMKFFHSFIHSAIYKRSHNVWLSE